LLYIAYSAAFKAFLIASLSTGSCMTKSSPYICHWEGKFLGGGIGIELFMGLGWSDSEDDDASSPLTKQPRTAGFRKRAASDDRRQSSLMREVKEGTREREDVMHTGSIENMGNVRNLASMPSVTHKVDS
jgi:hypothetical protein